MRAKVAVGCVLAATACADPVAEVSRVEVVPRPAALRRLTRVQFTNALRDLVGEGVVVPDALPPDPRSDGLTNVASTQAALPPTAVEKLEKALSSVADQVITSDAARARLLPCAKPADVACLAETVRGLGLRAWRRPLTDEEVNGTVALARSSATALGDPWAALGVVLTRLLQSPEFLYVFETPIDGRLDAYGLATRLALFLTDTLPDTPVLAAAANGTLTDDAVLRQQVDRLLALPASRTALRRFFAELYGIDRLRTLQKDSTLFVHMSLDLMRSAEEQALSDLERLVFDADGDFRTFLTSPETRVDRQLAALYGIPAPSQDAFSPVVLTGERRGFFGQVAFLAVQAHPRSTSAVLRGKFIRTVLLCGLVPAPPVNVNTGLPEPAEGARTLRERVAVHLQNESCRSCHQLMDPIGLGLERFDGIGRFRTTDAGATIDSTGTVDGKPFADAAELGQVVASHPNFPGCFAKHLYRHATAGRETVGEVDLLEALGRAFTESGYRVKPLIRAVALSRGFRTVGAATEVTP